MEISFYFQHQTNQQREILVFAQFAFTSITISGEKQKFLLTSIHSAVWLSFVSAQWEKLILKRNFYFHTPS